MRWQRENGWDKETKKNEKKNFTKKNKQKSGVVPPRRPEMWQKQQSNTSTTTYSSGRPLLRNVSLASSYFGCHHQLHFVNDSFFVSRLNFDRFPRFLFRSFIYAPRTASHAAGNGAHSLFSRHGPTGFPTFFVTAGLEMRKPSFLKIAPLEAGGFAVVATTIEFLSMRHAWKSYCFFGGAASIAVDSVVSNITVSNIVAQFDLCFLFPISYLMG